MVKGLTTLPQVVVFFVAQREWSSSSERSGEWSSPFSGDHLLRRPYGDQAIHAPLSSWPDLIRPSTPHCRHGRT